MEALKHAQKLADYTCDKFKVSRVLIKTSIKKGKGGAVYVTHRIKGYKKNYPDYIVIYDWDTVKVHEGELIMRLSHELAHHIKNVVENKLVHSHSHGELEDKIGLTLSRLK